MNLHNKILKAINKGLNEALTRFDLDDFDDNELDNDNIKLNKSKSTKSAMNKSILNEWIYKNFVDLDLPSGTLWCKYNIGANSPEEYGNYYAWGETEPKGIYTLKNYKFINNSVKYNNKIVLDLEDDVAYQYDNNMCIPTKELFDELIKNTDNEWTEYNNVNGRIFKSKLNPDKFIFIPAAGYIGYTQYIGDNYNNRYWSSTLYTVNNSRAYFMSFYSISDIGIYLSERHVGMPIRPVLKK